MSLPLWQIQNQKTGWSLHSPGDLSDGTRKSSIVAATEPTAALDSVSLLKSYKLMQCRPPRTDATEPFSLLFPCQAQSTKLPIVRVCARRVLCRSFAYQKPSLSLRNPSIKMRFTIASIGLFALFAAAQDLSSLPSCAVCRASAFAPSASSFRLSLLVTISLTSRTGQLRYWRHWQHRLLVDRRPLHLHGQQLPQRRRDLHPRRL